MLKQFDFDETKFLDSIICYEENKAISKFSNTVNICFNIDSNFFMPLGVAITSILENNKDMNFNFHIFIDEAFDDDLQKLQKTMINYKQNAFVYIMRTEPFANFHVKHIRFKRVSYFRLYMPKLLKKITNKYIYIDADLICVSSMKPFIELDLEGNVLGAVSEYPKDVEYRSNFLKLKSEKYFN